MTAPMASYVATVAIGRFAELRTTGPGGLPIVTFVPPDRQVQATSAFAELPEMIAYFEGILGPYPFDSFGYVLLDRHFRWGLETQTRPISSVDLMTMNPYLFQEAVSHELAHQWFGDSVTPASWQDVWLNEGFATYLSWLWLEHLGDREFLDGLMRSQYGYVLNAPLYARLLDNPNLPPAQVLPIVRALFLPDGQPQSDAGLLRAAGLTSLDQLTSRRALGLLGVRPGSSDARSYQGNARSSAPAQPPPADLFTTAVYSRGAMALQALRVRVGDAIFFDVLRTYAGRYALGNASTKQFIAVASEVTGQDLDSFFQTWLSAPSPPPLPELLPGQ